MNNKKKTQQAHNAIAKQYYEAYKDDTTDLAYFDEFLSMFEGCILDLGCGMGHYSNYMHRHGFDVTGIDFSSEMINIAKRTNPNIEFINSDICDLSSIESRYFDGIVIAYVLQHLSKKEVNKLFLSLNKHITNKSKLLLFLREGNSIVTEVEPMNPKYEYVINEYTKEEIKIVLNSSGWKVIKIEDKDFIEDPNSLAPHTIVVFAER